MNNAKEEKVLTVDEAYEYSISNSDGVFSFEEYLNRHYYCGVRSGTEQGILRSISILEHWASRLFLENIDEKASLVRNLISELKESLTKFKEESRKQ